MLTDDTAGFIFGRSKRRRWDAEEPISKTGEQMYFRYELWTYFGLHFERSEERRTANVLA